MGITQIALAASLLLSPLLHQADDAPLHDPVRPAMWKVADGDTTIYLFGTFHALDGSTHWFKDNVRTAFEASDQLVLETLIPTAAQTSKPSHPLSTARTTKPAPASLLASAQMVMNAGRARGMSSRHGADAELRQAADASGKPVGALESFDYQIRMFSTLAAGSPAQPQPAAATPAAALTLSAVLAKLQDAWNRGDMATFRPMLDQMRVQSPHTYRTMFTERNARWASWIAGRLHQPGTVFVAVGAGHLAGGDSVQHQLAMRGVRSTRVN